MKKASEKQIKWITEWFKESGKSVIDYLGKGIAISQLEMGQAGIIIGNAKKEIKDMGYDTVEEYILSIKKGEPKTHDFGQYVKDALHDLRAWYLTEGYNEDEAIAKCMRFITKYYFK